MIVRTSTPEPLELEAIFLPDKHQPPKHWHPEQDERFEILEGTVLARVDGQEHTLGAGDVLDIPRGAVHQFWNPGPAPAKAVWQVRPAGRTEHWFRSIDALHRQGKVGRGGMPGPLAYAVFLTEVPRRVPARHPGGAAGPRRARAAGADRPATRLPAAARGQPATDAARASSRVKNCRNGSRCDS